MNVDGLECTVLLLTQLISCSTYEESRQRSRLSTASLVPGLEMEVVSRACTSASIWVSTARVPVEAGSSFLLLCLCSANPYILVYLPDTNPGKMP